MVFLIPCELIELDNAISKIDVSISSTDKVWKLRVCFYVNRRLETEGLILNFLHSRSLLSLNPCPCHSIQWYKASNPSCDRERDLDRDRIDSNVHFGLHIVLYIIIMVALFYLYMVCLSFFVLCRCNTTCTRYSRGATTCKRKIRILCLVQYLNKKQ